MKTLCFLLAAAIVLVWRHYAMKKIDADLEESLRTPGTAKFIRANFGEFLEAILIDERNYIIFERTDQIRIGRKNVEKYELIIGNMMDFGGPVIYVVLQSGDKVILEEKFKKGTNCKEISERILPFFNIN